jgi:hypothetical protein
MISYVAKNQKDSADQQRELTTSENRWVVDFDQRDTMARTHRYCISHHATRLLL